MVFDVVGGVAGAGDRMPVGAECVAGHVQPFLGARLVDRPVLAAAHRLLHAALEQHLHEAPVARATAHLGGRPHRVLAGDHHRSAQPVVAVQPLGYLPVVAGARQGGAQLQVERGVGQDRGLQNRVGDMVGIEKVAAGELHVGARRTAGRRPGILAVIHEARIVAAVGGAHAERVQVVAPALRQVGVEILERVDLVVQVAIDDRGAGCRAGLGGGHFPHVHDRCRHGLAHVRLLAVLQAGSEPVQAARIFTANHNLQ